ncbi:MAG: type II toxin-antitoxin system YafQ family toxin [Clostridiales bacterium]|nr:type II toxin-antitoxin system YafQ family toxin [Clostridiales bacterium]
MDKLKAVIERLIGEGVPLPAQNRDRKLTGDFTGDRECHIQPDYPSITYARSFPSGNSRVTRHGYAPNRYS